MTLSPLPAGRGFPEMQAAPLAAATAAAAAEAGAAGAGAAVAWAPVGVRCGAIIDTCMGGDSR